MNVRKVAWIAPLAFLLIAGPVWFAWQKTRPPLRIEMVYDTANGMDAPEEIKNVIAKRLELMAVAKFEVVTTNNGVIVRLPDMPESEVNKLQAMIGQMGKLEWRLEAPANILTQWNQARAADPNTPSPDPGKYQIFEASDAYMAEMNTGRAGPLPRMLFLLETENVIRGHEIEEARKTTDSNVGMPALGFKLNSNGKRTLAEFTKRENKGRRLVIVLNDRVESAPSINDPLTGGAGIITFGGATSKFEEVQERRDDLLVTIQAGSLRSALKLLSRSSINPDREP